MSTPTIIPEIKYTFKNGVFVSANSSYIPNRSTNKLDGENITLGYDHDFTDDLSAGISFAKLFYTANSTQIGSSISSTISANISYDIADIISPNLSADYDLIKNGFSNDIIINLGIAHDFSKKGLFGSKDILVISPTIELNAGTQNFYEAFLTTKKYKTTAKAIVANAKLNKQLAKLNQFNMLDYELSAPIAYKTGKLTLSFTPTYAIAENKVAPAISKGLVAGTGLFYFNAGATITFE